MSTEKPVVVSKREWLRQRRALLRDEKALMRYKDLVTKQRQALPWVRVEEEYVFATLIGDQTLSDLFEDCSQLIVYHFMFGPDAEQGCEGCTQVADSFNLARHHIRQRDARLVSVSRTALDNIERYKKRMGWSFDWVSSLGSDFNFDYQASYPPGTEAKYFNYEKVEEEIGENHGLSVFVKDASGTIFHTYSCYARQIELYMVNLQYLDLLPFGRQDEKYPETVRRA